MSDDLHDAAPDEALALALMALGPAADEAGRLVLEAIASGRWQEALLAIEDLVSASADALEPSLYAALLAGGARVGSRLPADSVPSQQPGPPVPHRPGVADAMEGLSPELRALFLAAMGGGVGGVGEPAQPAHGKILPLAQRAREALLAKNLVTHDQFRQLGEEARSRSLAVAGVVREQVLSRLQPLLAEAAESPSLAGFKRRLREEGLDEDIAGRHVETAFRDAVQLAYADGMERILEDPLAGDAFPFVETLPIRDSRISKACEWASRSGIHGGPIYKRDDPAWQLVRPPRHPNCRCGTNPLTREMAAERGVGHNAGHVTLPDGLVRLLRR